LPLMVVVASGAPNVPVTCWAMVDTIIAITSAMAANKIGKTLFFLMQFLLILYLVTGRKKHSHHWLLINSCTQDTFQGVGTTL
jgi:uncharacterized membrane protein YtjA (UPF0391 family)